MLSFRWIVPILYLLYFISSEFGVNTIILKLERLIYLHINNLIFIFYPPRGTSKNQFFKKLSENIFNDPNINYNLISITVGPESKKFLKTVDVKWKNTYDILEFIHKEDSTYDIKKFADFTEKYEVQRINEVFEHSALIFSKDYPASDYNDQDKNKLLYSILKFWEKVLKNNRNSILIDEGVAGLFTPLYNFFKKFDSIVFNMTISRTDNNFVITNNGYQNWHKLNKKYDYNIFSKNELEISSKYRDEFINKRIKPKWYYTENKSNNIEFSKLFEKIGIINKVKSLFRHLIYPNNIFVRKTSSLFTRKFSVFKRITHNNFVKWDKFDKNKKYFIYPLHVKPEATINVLGTYYTNQLDLIKKISLALPIDTYLYVKEHSASVGERKNMEFYKQIRSLKNVRLINPYIDPHEIIKNSISTITISSTMGFESIFYGKPIILFGDAFYEPYKYAYKVNDIKNIYSLMNKCIERNGKIENIEILKFIASYLYSLYEGNLYFYKDKNALSDDNIEKIKNGIKQEIQYLNFEGENNECY